MIIHIDLNYGQKVAPPLAAMVWSIQVLKKGISAYTPYSPSWNRAIEQARIKIWYYNKRLLKCIASRLMVDEKILCTQWKDYVWMFVTSAHPRPKLTAPTRVWAPEWESATVNGPPLSPWMKDFVMNWMKWMNWVNSPLSPWIDDSWFPFLVTHDQDPCYHSQGKTSTTK